MKVESIEEVLGRLLRQKPPHREAPLLDAPVQPDATPKDRSQTMTIEPPSFTQEEKRLVEYLTFYIEGYSILRQLERMSWQTGFSGFQFEQIAAMMDEILGMLRAVQPVVDQWNKLGRLHLQTVSKYREYTEWCDKRLLNRKVDLIQGSLDLIFAKLDSLTQKPPAQKPIGTVAEFCERVIAGK